MSVPLWASIPFVSFLLVLAFVPLARRAWWERYHPHVCIAVGVGAVAGYLFLFRGYGRAWETAHEYVSFVVLLGSLFVVTGGILIRIEGAVSPLLNTGLLLVGAIIANLMGTTGASMLLIRPYLHLNRERMQPYLVIFFIFLVSNIGGALTPIGDPPLFLGYLKGVPFFWLIGRVWHIWALAVGLLLAIFFLIDSRNHGGEQKPKPHGPGRIVVTGWSNLIFLGLVIFAVFQSTPLREAIMVAAAAASYVLTPASIHRGHGFTFHPIREVALYFFAIFATMIPTLQWLEGNAGGLLLSTPGHFYWASGTLSSFLDNAPTYLNFLSAEVGRLGIAVPEIVDHSPQFIVAISLGAVFFGAMTYIGNGPNFMVKAIADRAGTRCPSFFGYMVRYSIPILIPIFFLVWFVFLRS